MNDIGSMKRESELKLIEEDLNRWMAGKKNKAPLDILGWGINRYRDVDFQLLVRQSKAYRGFFCNRNGIDSRRVATDW